MKTALFHLITHGHTRRGDFTNCAIQFPQSRRTHVIMHCSSFLLEMYYFFIYFNALCRGDQPPPNGGLPLCKCFLLLSKDRTLSEVFTIQLLGRGAAVTNRCSVMDNCDKVPGNSYFGWVQWAHRISLTIKLLRRVTIVAKMVCNTA